MPINNMECFKTLMLSNKTNICNFSLPTLKNKQ